MRPIRRYAAIDDTEETEVLRRVSIKRQDGRSIVSEPLKQPFYFIIERVSRRERVSWKFVAPQDAEIQVNIFAQFEWMTAGDVDPGKLLS